MITQRQAETLQHLCSTIARDNWGGKVSVTVVDKEWICVKSFSEDGTEEASWQATEYVRDQLDPERKLTLNFGLWQFKEDDGDDSGVIMQLDPRAICGLITM